MEDCKNCEQEDTYGAQYRFECFHEKNPTGCHQLGVHLFGQMQQPDKAKIVFSMNCNENRFAESCLSLGHQLLLGKGVKADVDGACESYNKGCELGNGESCKILGMIHELGHTSLKDGAKAATYYEKSCSLGSSQGCHMLSSMYLAGKDGVPRNMKEAHRYAVEACKGGELVSCANLSMMYTNGDGVKKNEKLGLEIRKLLKNVQSELKNTKSSSKEDTSIMRQFKVAIESITQSH